MATTVPDNPFDTQPANPTNQNPSQSAGIVASALPAPNTAMTYTPETRQVNQGTETVQGQVNSILSKDSPLMQRARTMATQQMAQRGLVNSSMAVGAGQAAMIDRALPIAQQDANTYSTVSSENMASKNRASEFGAGQLNQFSLQKGAQEFQATQAGLDRTQQTNLQTSQQNFQSAQSALDRALSTYQQDKSLASQQALQNAQFNFQGAQAALDRSQQSALQVGQQEFQAAQQNIQNDFNSRMQQLQESGQDFRQARDIASREAMTRLAEMGVTNRFDQELALRSNQFNIEQYNLERRQVLQNQMELDKIGLQIKAQNAQIPTTFAANISNTAMAGVNSVYAQPMDANGKPTADERRAQAQSIVNYANSQISWAEKFYSTAIPRINL